MCIIWSVIQMQYSMEMLSSVLRTVQRGQTGIRSILDVSMQPGLRKTLENQLLEYDAIETEANAIAIQRGWELTDLDPAVRFFTDMARRMKLNGRNQDSKIADIIIRDNTRGMIHGLKKLHRFTAEDDQIRILSQRLLDCETAHIRKMQFFL